MSTTILVQSILDEAAVRFGDPNKTHFTDAILLTFYNDATEDVSGRWQILEVDASFSWIAGEDRYSYPDDSVQMLRLQYNATPVDPTLWRKVYEIDEQEYVGLTDGTKPAGDDKLYYWARSNFFVVWPVPVTAVSQGGLVGYWKLADRQLTAVTAVDATGLSYSRTVIEMPNMTRVAIRDRMVIGMEMSVGRTQEAEIRLAHWEQEMDKVWDRVDDPVDDRRERYRPEPIQDWTRVV